MKTLRRLLILRKQNDRIKIQWLLCILAVFFVGRAIIQGVGFYELISTPREYELELPANQTEAEYSFRSLQEIEYVKAVTEEIEGTVTFQVHSATVSIRCISVSETYLKEAYGLEMETGMTVMCVNQEALRDIQDVMGTNTDMTENEINDTQSGGLQCTYEMDGKCGVARIILLDDIQEEEACVFQASDSSRLQKEGTGIRIYMERQDIDGTQLQEIQAAGYTFRDESSLQCFEYQKQIIWIKVQNNFVLGVLFAVFAFILHWLKL